MGFVIGTNVLLAIRSSASGKSAQDGSGELVRVVDAPSLGHASRCDCEMGHRIWQARRLRDITSSDKAGDRVIQRASTAKPDQCDDREHR
jgi:hypothetical protein